MGEKEVRVLRDSRNNLLKVDEYYFSLSEVVDHVYTIVCQYSDNPGFDMPPWFFSGSPYADEILRLGITPIQHQVREFTPEFTPAARPTWRANEPKWMSIFNSEEKYA
jgi:hypothetical protein